MMYWALWRQRYEEMMREEEVNHLARALRKHRRETRGGRTSALAWELRRGAGILLKLVRTLKNTRKGGNP